MLKQLLSNEYKRVTCSNRQDERRKKRNSEDAREINALLRGKPLKRQTRCEGEQVDDGRVDARAGELKGEPTEKQERKKKKLQALF